MPRYVLLELADDGTVTASELSDPVSGSFFAVPPAPSEPAPPPEPASPVTEPPAPATPPTDQSS